MSNSLQSPRLESSKLLCPWNSPGKNTGVGSHSLLPGIFLMQGLNLHLLYCRQILCHPSHEESPRRVKPFVDSCSDFSDLCTCTGLHSDYVASLSFRDSELTEGGLLFGHRLGPWGLQGKCLGLISVSWSTHIFPGKHTYYFLLPRQTLVSSVAQSCLTLHLHGLQHTRLPCPSPTPARYGLY